MLDLEDKSAVINISKELNEIIVYTDVMNVCPNARD